VGESTSSFPREKKNESLLLLGGKGGGGGPHFPKGWVLLQGKGRYHPLVAGQIPLSQ